MTQGLGDVFADTTYWIALVVKQDQYHKSLFGAVQTSQFSTCSRRDTP